MRRRITTQEDLDRPKVRRVIVILIAGTVTAGVAAWLAGVDVRDELSERRVVVAASPADPIRAELIRCNGIGQAALDDAACRSAWAENRRRFFGAANRQPSTVNERPTAPLATPATREPTQ